MMKPGITRDEIVRLFGELTDQQILEILDSGASQQDLELAAAYAAQQDDVMGELEKPLSGAAAEIYEIVMSEQEHPEEEHAP